MFTIWKVSLYAKQKALIGFGGVIIYLVVLVRPGRRFIFILSSFYNLIQKKRHQLFMIGTEHGPNNYLAVHKHGRGAFSILEYTSVVSKLPLNNPSLEFSLSSLELF